VGRVKSNQKALGKLDKFISIYPNWAPENFREANMLSDGASYTTYGWDYYISILCGDCLALEDRPPLGPQHNRSAVRDGYDRAIRPAWFFFCFDGAVLARTEPVGAVGCVTFGINGTLASKRFRLSDVPEGYQRGLAGFLYRKRGPACLPTTPARMRFRLQCHAAENQSKWRIIETEHRVAASEKH